MGSYLDPAFTYCFEFCSPKRRIIKEYEKSCVFLLSAIDNLTHKEKSDSELKEIALKIDALVPTHYNFQSIEEVLSEIRKLSQTNPS